MSLRAAAGKVHSDKRTIPVFDGSDLAMFAEWYDRLTSLIKSKGRRVRQCLHGKGPFRNMTFSVDDDGVDLDDYDDLRQELKLGQTSDDMQGIPEEDIDLKHGLRGPGFTSKKDLDNESVKTVNQVKENDDAESTTSATSKEIEIAIQIRHNEFSMYIYEIILRHIGRVPHEEIRNQHVAEGDGPTAYKKLALMCMGQGSIGLIGVVKRLTRIAMIGKLQSLSEHTSEFRRLVNTMMNLKHPISNIWRIACSAKKK